MPTSDQRLWDGRWGDCSMKADNQEAEMYALKFFSWPSIYMSKPLGCWVASYARTTQFQGEGRFVFEHAMFSQALFFSLDSETLQHFRRFQAEKSTFDSQEKFGDFKWHTCRSPELIWLMGTWGYHILLLIFLTLHTILGQVYVTEPCVVFYFSTKAFSSVYLMPAWLSLKLPQSAWSSTGVFFKCHNIKLVCVLQLQNMQ